MQAYGNIKSQQLDVVMRRMISEAITPGFASDVLIDSLSTQAMIELTRYFDCSGREDSCGRAKMAQWQIRRIKEYVESCTYSAVQLADLARLCGISSRHLQRGFKATNGVTLHKYIEEVRLSRAQDLLANTNLAMKQISGQLGFTSQSGFAIAFRRLTGDTPSDFRRRSGNQTR